MTGVITIRTVEYDDGRYIHIHDAINSYDTQFRADYIDNYIQMLDDILSNTYHTERCDGDRRTHRAGRDYDLGENYNGNWIKYNRIKAIKEKLFSETDFMLQKEYDNMKEALKEICKLKRFVKKSIKEKLNDKPLRTLLMVNSRIK